jgi:dihydropteroate synthase
MGIINLTPDSFSDGNPHLSLSSVETRIQEFKDSDLIEILDIGAESTRPEAQLLSPEEEWERIKNFIPLFQKASQTFKISLDTRHFETLEKFHALCPVSFWNCVSLPENTNHLRKFATLKIPLILMHHLSIPPNPNDTLKTSSTFYLEMRKWFQEKINDLNDLGIHEIILDPGIGFGKTPLQNIELFDHMDKFEDLKKPILIGHSRKSFIEKEIFSGVATSLQVKDEASALISWKLMNLGIAYLRIHNPLAHKDLFKVLNSIHISW